MNPDHHRLQSISITNPGRPAVGNATFTARSVDTSTETKELPLDYADELDFARRIGTFYRGLADMMPAEAALICTNTYLMSQLALLTGHTIPAIEITTGGAA